MTQAGAPIQLGGIQIGAPLRVGGTHAGDPVVVPGGGGTTNDRVIPLSWQQPVQDREWVIPYDPTYRLASFIVTDSTGDYVDPDIVLGDGEVRFGFSYPTIGRADLTLMKV